LNKPGIVILRATPIHPDPRVEKIGRALAQAGYSIQALGWNRDGSLPVVEYSAGFPIQRLAINASPAQGLGNLPAHLRWQFALFTWLRRQRNSYQVLHACDFDTILPALWAQRLWGKKVIYDIFDFYADMLRATPRPIKSFLRRLDLAAIGRADALLLADDARYAQITGAKPRRSAVIYNSPEDITKNWNPTDPIAPKTDKDVSLRLAYIGLLQLERGLLPLLKVLSDHPEWHLDLAGSGAEAMQIAEKARVLRNVTFHGKVPYDRALALSAAVDVLPAFYDPAIPNHRFASPNKLFEGMMLAKPLVAAHGTSFDRILIQEHCGLVVDYGNCEQLAAALKRLEDPDLRQRLGTNARHAYDTSYGWKKMVERLLDIYQAVIA
jgi:glycosyltransferase involved in cell wall biosynthesis